MDKVSKKWKKKREKMTDGRTVIRTRFKYSTKQINGFHTWTSLQKLKAKFT